MISEYATNNAIFVDFKYSYQTSVIQNSNITSTSLRISLAKNKYSVKTIYKSTNTTPVANVTNTLKFNSLMFSHA